MAVLIRPASMQDYPALAAIGSQNQELHFQGCPAIFQQGTAGLTEEYVRNQLENAQGMAFVADEDGQVIGYVFVRLRILTYLNIFRPHVVAKVTDLAVTEQERGKGTGRLLFNAAKYWARRQRAERLELTVWEFNEHARQFYERLGMLTISRTMSLPLA